MKCCLIVYFSKNLQTIESHRSNTSKKSLWTETKIIPLERINFIPIPKDPRSRRLLNEPEDFIFILPAFARNMPITQERKKNSNLRPLSYIRQQQRLRMADPRLRARDTSALFGSPTKLPGEMEMENGLPKFKSGCLIDKNKATGSQNSSPSDRFSSDEDGVYRTSSKDDNTSPVPPVPPVPTSATCK